MCKRLIIINWKFQEGYQSEWDVCDLKDCKVVCYNTNDSKKFNQKISNLKSEKTLILLHSNTPNDNVKSDNIQCPSDLGKIKKYIFQGGTDPIYVTTNTKLGLLFANGSNLDDGAKIKKDNKEYIKKENFEFVWDGYWNKLDLEYLKKKIINLWLPLAIDIQGLSEVENSKINDYLNEICKEFDNNDYVKKLSDGWEEVKKILLPESENKEVLDKKYQLTKEEKEKVKIPIENISADSLKNFVKENYKNTTSDHFLPNWLQEVVSIIDKKIKEPDNTVSTNNEAAES